MDSIIKGGEIVTACDNYTADIGIEVGKIRLIGKDLAPDSGTEIIDAAGKLVMPGIELMPILLSLTRKKKLLLIIKTWKQIVTGTRIRGCG